MHRSRHDGESAPIGNTLAGRIEEDGMQFHFGLVWRLSRSRRKITVDQEACSVIRWSSCASTMLGVFEVKQ
jgi:hypothetical protein